MNSGANQRGDPPALTRRSILSFIAHGTLFAGISALTGCDGDGDLAPTEAAATAPPSPLLPQATHDDSGTETTPEITPLPLSDGVITPGVWIHSVSADRLIAADAAGFMSTRGYALEHAIDFADAVDGLPLNHFVGFHVEATDILDGWQSQVDATAISRLADLRIPVVALSVGNELRDPRNLTRGFTRDLARNLARILISYREVLDQQRLSDWLLTYTFEMTSLDDHATFTNPMRTVIDVSDVVSVNLYPLQLEHWIGTEAFNLNRQFLTDPVVRRERLDRFEQQLRGLLSQVAERGKKLILGEVGLPSGVDFVEDEGLIWPVHDVGAFADAYGEMMSRIMQASSEYPDILEAIYIYEWWDNLYHEKIIGQNSPIHNCFGLHDAEGNAKFDLESLLGILR